MPENSQKKAALHTLASENEMLRARLEELEETIRAIRGGEVDALVVETEEKPSIRHIVDDEILAQSILEQVADAVIICNKKGIILRASRAVKEMYEGETLHKHFDTVFPLYVPGADHDRRLTFESILFSETLRGFEVLFRNEENENFYLLLSVGLLYSLEHYLLGAVITLTDITERKHAEAKLLQADNRKDEFLATLAHELRNPLAPINNALHVIELAHDKPEIRKEACDTLGRQLKQMVRLVDDLIDVSRITRNAIELRKEHIRLNDVIQSAVETSQPLIESNRHELTITLPRENVYIDADFMRMSQIFVNLLNNAAKYTPPGGRIHLEARLDGTMLKVSVRDSGIGIDKHMLPHIFDMFAQADSSMERSQGGLGIGLTLVKSLLALHGGTIRAKSAGLASGSEFTVTLPAFTQPDTVAGKPKSEQKAKGPSLRILVVDDNVSSAQTMGWMLELMGHEPHLAHNGAEVLSKAITLKPDVILLDIGLPGKNGYDVCRELRAHPSFAQTTLIAQTGWGQEQDKRLAREAGFTHHLVKPVDMEALQKSLRDVKVDA